MTNNVTPEALSALAALAICGLHDENPIGNLPRGAEEAMHELLDERYGFSTLTPEMQQYVSGLAHGVEIGLRIAAAIVTHGLDTSEIQNAVERIVAEMETPEALGNVA